MSIAAFLAENIVSYALGTSMEILINKITKKTFTKKLKKTIIKTENEFKKNYIYADEDGKCHFYESEIFCAELLKYRLFNNDGYEINSDRIQNLLKENPNIIIPKKDIIEDFLKLFDKNMSEDDDLKDLAIEECYKSEIFKISEKISDIFSEFEELKSNLKNITIKKTPHALTKNPVILDFFIGRDEEITELRNKLTSGENLILLVNGNGGMGKTSLAAKYYNEYRDDYKHVAWVVSEKSIVNALLELSYELGIDLSEELQPEKKLDLLLSEMANLEKPCLLVIDNANEIEDLEKNYLALKRCGNFHILLSTRISNFNNIPSLKINGLKNRYAVKLFREYYPEHDENEDDLLNQIIEDVGNNTLIIELFARNLHNINIFEPNYTLTKLSEDIKNNIAKLTKSTEVRTSYRSIDHSLRNEKPESIVMAMYDLSNLTEEEKELISVFAALPNEAISFTFLKNCFSEKDIQKHLKKLSDKGWIDFESKEKRFRINQIVKDVVLLKQEKRLYDDCKPLIDYLNNYLSDEAILHKDKIYLTQEFIRYSESIINNITSEENNVIALHDLIGNYYYNTGDLLNVLKIYGNWNEFLYELSNSKKNNVDFKRGLAISYEKLGETHSALGNLDNALSFFKDETIIFEQLHNDFPSSVDFKHGLAISYEKLGQTHSTLGNLDNALSFFQKYNSFSEQLHNDFPDNVSFKNGLAISYEKLGETHSALGNLDNALSFFKDETSIFEQLHNDFPDNVSFKNGLAISYEKLGQTHSALGNLDNALSFFQKYNSFSEQLHNDFPDNVSFKNVLAISYSKLGETHSKLGNLDNALYFFEKDTSISEQLHNDFPDNVSFKNGLAISYSKLGETHSALGNLDNALSFFQKYNSFSEQLHNDFPDNVSFKNGLAISYSKLGETHSTLGNLDNALSFFKDETIIFEQLHDDFPDNVSFKNGLAISYSKLGETHSALGNLDNALSFFEKDTFISEQLHNDFPSSVDFKHGLAISYEKLGQTHSTLGNLDNALSFFQKYNSFSEQLHNDFPDNVSFKNGLAISYEKLGEIHSTLGNLDNALSFFKDETIIFEQLHNDFPDNSSFKNGLAISYIQLAVFQRDKLKDLKKSLQEFQKAERLLRELTELSPKYYAFKNNYEILKKDIEELKKGVRR